MDEPNIYIGETFGKNVSVEAMRYLSDADKKEDFI